MGADGRHRAAAVGMEAKAMEIMGNGEDGKKNLEGGGEREDEKWRRRIMV